MKQIHNTKINLISESTAVQVFRKKAKCVDTLRGRDLLLCLFDGPKRQVGVPNPMRQYPIQNSNAGYLSSQVQRVDLDSNQDIVAPRAKLNNAPRCPSASW
jgi:hypothetical protein